MDTAFGTLELNRTNPAHIGTSPIGQKNRSQIGALNGAGSARDVRGAGETGSFESYLMDAVNKMNAQQLDVAALEEKVITDPESVDIQDVTIAMAKAEMSLNLAQTVIDRLVNAWTDLSQNR